MKRIEEKERAFTLSNYSFGILKKSCTTLKESCDVSKESCDYKIRMTLSEMRIQKNLHSLHHPWYIVSKRSTKEAI